MKKAFVFLFALLLTCSALPVGAQPVPIITAEIIPVPVYVTPPVTSMQEYQFIIRMTNNSDPTVYAGTYLTNFESFWLPGISTAQVAPGQSIDLPARSWIMGSDQIDACNAGESFSPWTVINWTIQNADGSLNMSSYSAIEVFVDCGSLATETPTETPTEAPTETPVETPSVTPTETPAVTPTEIPVETPSVTPTVISTAVSTSTPTQTPDVTPTDVPLETPTQTPGVTPTVSSTEVPVVTPAETPTDGITQVVEATPIVDTVDPVTSSTVTQLPSTGTDKTRDGSPLAIIVTFGVVGGFFVTTNIYLRGQKRHQR